jgi:DNA-binding Lrp family transcriptional regulator
VPLARAEKVIKKKESPRMDFLLLWPTKGIHPFADMILELYAEKIINASSVGFIPFKWNRLPDEAKEDDGERHTWGREYVKQELLELSGCAVPSNPNALQNALLGKSFGFKPEEMLKWLTGATLIPRPEKVDDVLEEITKTQAEIIDETSSVQVQVPKEYAIPPEEKSKEEPLEESIASNSDKVNVTPEETKTIIKIMVDEGDIKDIKLKLDGINGIVQGVAEQIKGILASQAIADDKGPKKPDDRGLASLILGEGFNQGKSKVPAPSVPSGLTKVGVESLKQALLELNNIVKQIKINP